MLEKRVHKRRHLVYYLRAVDNATGREIGRVGDISPAGILLVSKGKIALQTEYKVGIELSDLENNRQHHQLNVKIKKRKENNKFKTMEIYLTVSNIYVTFYL